MVHAHQLRTSGLVTAVALLVLLSSPCSAKVNSSSSNYYIFPVDVRHAAIRTQGRSLLDAGKLDIDGRWGLPVNHGNEHSSDSSVNVKLIIVR
jgi:hypothetical protein